MKRSIKTKTLCAILSLLLVLQIVPLTSFATENELVATTAPFSETNKQSQIVCEMEEKRTEYSKDFLMSDGSHYCIATAFPMHTLIDGNWENVSDSLDNIEDSENISEATESISLAISETVVQNDTSTSTYQIQESNSITVEKNFLKNEYNASGGFTTSFTIKSSNGAMRVLADYIDPYLNSNNIINYANISFDCTVTTTNEIYAYEGSGDAGSADADTIESYRLIDKISISESNQIEFDLTDTFNRWLLGIIENKGVIIRATGTEKTVVDNFVISFSYETVEQNDLNFTYHTIDMGYAGNAYINNYTNTMWFDIPLFNINSAVFPQSVSLVNNAVNPLSDTDDVYGFKFNVLSSIVFENNTFIWKTFDSENKYFISGDTIVTEDGYQIWYENGKSDYHDNTSMLLYLPESEATANPINYGNVFLKQGDTKYSFDSDGRIASVARPNSNNTISTVQFAYVDNRINQITTENNTTYSFTYAESDLGTNNISEITLNNSTDKITFDISIGYTEDDDSIAVTEITTLDGNKYTCETDTLGNVLKVQNNKNCWTFTHNKDESKGNKIQSYQKYTIDDENNLNLDYSIIFNAPNGYFRKIEKTQGEDIFTEIIQYDREHRIITHKDFNGKYICAEYNDDGVLSSFAFNENTSNHIANAGFENSISDLNNGWTVNSTSVETVSSTLEGHGELELKIFSDVECDSTVIQPVSGSFYADNTYVIGAWVKVNGTIPLENNKIGIEVKDISTDGSVAFIEFDNSLDNEWQYRLKAFKLENNTDELQVTLSAESQIGDIRFDDITLFKAIESQADLNDIVTSSPVMTTYNNGKISSESISDGIYSLKQNYSYDAAGNLISKTDMNNITEYYSYSINSKQVGNIKTETGTISDATTITYTSSALDAIQSISQTVNGLTMSTNYSSVNDIDYIIHNGFCYSFSYNDDGSLKSIDMSNQMAVNETPMINYEYDSDTSTITYKNGTEVKFEYNPDGEILCIDYYSVNTTELTSNEKTLIESYEYQYDENGNLIAWYDSGTGYWAEYDEDGNYSLYTTKGNNTTPTELYQKEITNSGEIVETFRQAYFTGTNNTSEDTITTGNTTTAFESSTGSVTNSSSINVTKNASDNKLSTMAYSRNSVTDYFNRLTNKNTHLVYETGNGKTYNVESETNYEYKLLDVGLTSYLISSYSTSVYGDKAVSSAEMSEYETYTRFFEYDNKGNITYIYTQTDSTISPKNYYEYDEANQLVLSIDFTKGNLTEYTYDVGGNIVSQNTYNSSNYVFNHETRTLTSVNEVSSTVTYGYDLVYRDRLTSYNGSLINYDELGNPTNYVGLDCDNATITGNLEWNGNRLAAFDNSSIRIEYQYDPNGNRTMKTVYDKETASDGSISYSTTYTMSYIWENGVLKSLLYAGSDTEEVSLNIIYDQEGSPVGYITSMGMPYYYLKDINGNVLGLIHPDGTKLCSMSYDDWGTPYFSYYGDNILLKLVSKATAVLNPITYNGYIYDYETGMYCGEGRYYSPVWRRYLNTNNPLTLKEHTENVLDTNLYLLYNNNPINHYNIHASWSDEFISFGWNSKGFNVGMNELFASRAFCMVFANNFLEKYGEWDAEKGYTYLGMNNLRIASDIFAHYVANKAASAITKVNAAWGDGWILKNDTANRITIKNNDTNAWKYEKIWYAAPEIKQFAWVEGVYITL